MSNNNIIPLTLTQTAGGITKVNNRLGTFKFPVHNPEGQTQGFIYAWDIAVALKLMGFEVTDLEQPERKL